MAQPADTPPGWLAQRSGPPSNPARRARRGHPRVGWLPVSQVTRTDGAAGRNQGATCPRRLQPRRRKPRAWWLQQPGASTCSRTPSAPRWSTTARTTTLQHQSGVVPQLCCAAAVEVEWPGRAARPALGCHLTSPSRRRPWRAPGARPVRYLSPRRGTYGGKRAPQPPRVLPTVVTSFLAGLGVRLACAAPATGLGPGRLCRARPPRTPPRPAVPPDWSGDRAPWPRQHRRRPLGCPSPPLWAPGGPAPQSDGGRRARSGLAGRGADDSALGLVAVGHACTAGAVGEQSCFCKEAWVEERARRNQ